MLDSRYKNRAAIKKSQFPVNWIMFTNLSQTVGLRSLSMVARLRQACCAGLSRIRKLLALATHAAGLRFMNRAVSWICYVLLGMSDKIYVIIFQTRYSIIHNAFAMKGFILFQLLLGFLVFLAKHAMCMQMYREDVQ